MILLPFITLLSVASALSLKDQYSCISFTTSVFVDGQPHDTCWGHSYVILLKGYMSNFFCFHALWDVCTCFCGIYVQAHPQYLSFSVFSVVFFSQNNQLAINSWVQTFTWPLCHTDGYVTGIFGSYVTGLLHFLNTATSELQSVIMLTSWAKQ